MEHSKTFVNKRALVPEITVPAWKSKEDLILARIYVARHARDGTDLEQLLEILGIEEGVENGGILDTSCNRSA